ncbi:OmpA family protein [Flavobacterium sp. J27]|uniref:OmpA family protein n=1 Tax=Flavobacterium sp. J27 TaxID=2060419 RepID=UPI0010321622|nr:OmpA family protein [Flavobacterium sp. J27]
MKKLLLCVFCVPFFGMSQDSFIDDSPTINSLALNNDSLLKFILTDTGINTELSEIGATFFKDKFLIVSNKKRRHTKTTFNESLSQFNNNIYCTNVDKNGNLSFPLQFSTVLDSDFNEGSMTFANDDKTIYFTHTTENSNNFKLYSANLDLEIQGYWKDVREIPITTNDFSVETPFYNKIDNTIYFSSNMPGGFGGYDLYVGHIKADGTLENIKNLGKEVNSDKDEKYPFVTPENNYIYFSSTGHDTFGGYDVFRSSIVENSYINTRNLGSGLNTTKDEVGYILVSKNRGYISINKEDDKDNFDVYRFDIHQQEQQLNIVVVETNSKIKLPNASVVITDEFGQVIKETKTNDKGEVKLIIEPLTAYNISTNKEGYEPNANAVTASTQNNFVTETIKMNQKKAEIVDDAIVIENIFFDFNKATLKEESRLSLDKVVTVMNEIPEMTLTINAHTDNKGSDKYNLLLSQKRAKSAYDYLITKGINKSRLSHNGYGESKPLHDCGSNCTEVQDLENRRIEFKINKTIEVTDASEN